MQRFHAGSCNSAVNNGAISGIQSRDASRVDSSAVQPNFSQNSRRLSQLSSYKLRCDKEQLNPRLGPPDFHPQSPHCPEETLTREYAQSGYRETVEGLEESREIALSHLLTIKKPTIVKCKEAIKKCHRAINESRAQKRKAGQVYGVPLSGALLTKPGIFPEQRPSGEDFRKKWIEGLSQPHKRLRSLADHVPHGYRRKSLFEVLIRNNVPLLRATWFIKVTYLNQIRASSSSNLSSGFHDKTQISRSEQWTKDVIEYMQNLLDEFIARNNSHSNFHTRDRLSQSIYVGSVQPKSDSLSTFMGGEEPSLYTKWWYMVRIIHWHHAEGLVIPSLIIDWVLHQLQEKDLLCVLQLLLPIIYGVIETVVLSQTYVRILVGLAVRFIQEPSPGGSDLVNNSRRAYTISAVVEMLRYLILAVPDSFVALDCFPLPKCVVSHVVNDGSFLAKTADDSRKMKDGLGEVAGVLKDKYHEVQSEFLSFHSAVSSIQKRAETLSRVASPNHPGHGVGKASQVLDQALVHGDIGEAYKLFFENIWDGACADRWIEQVSPCLHTLLSQLGTITSSVLCSMFFICEWATCEYRDFRSAPHGLKFSGRKDFSQIYIAIRLLKRKMSNMPNLYGLNKKNNDISSIFETLAPFHDVIVCWIDQHEVHNGEGFKRLQLLIRELIRSGIFNPHAYVRQLIVSGIMDENGPMVDLKRRKRHYKLLKELPASYVCDVMGENQIAEPLILLEASKIYSNERRLVLHGLLGDMNSTRNANSSTKKQKHLHVSGSASASPSPIDQWLPQTITKSKTNVETNLKLEELKASICTLLQLPFSSLSTDGVDESQSNIKRPGVIYNRTDIGEEASGCEECSRVKRQKLSDERSSHLQSNPADDEDLWWVNKGLMHMESFKVEQPPKPAKQASRGRQKSVRKTQSLAQLASARIEGSQGASTSHVCESRIGCPHHRSTSDDVLKSIDGVRKAPSGDVISIGKLLKKMKFVGKRSLTEWLIITVKELIEEAEKTAAKVVQFGKPSPAVDDRSSSQWRLGEDELSAILYVMDVCDELVSATRFLLWLLTKVPSNPGSTIQSRNIMMPHKIAENHVCEVGEAFIISTIRRYENILAAADLIPEILTATMRRTSSVLASNGRLSSSPSFLYACHLLRKYSNVATVVEWEKAFKPTFDKRLSSELESGRSLEGDFGIPLGVPNGVEDLDDYFRQKISGIRVSRVGLNMNQIVHRHVDEAFHNFFNGKDRKPFNQGTNKSPNKEKFDDCYPISRKIVTGLMDCIRQTGGAAQEGDPSLVSSAIAAIVNNVGQAIAKIPDLTTSRNSINVTSPCGSLPFARRILRIHITCLCLLKEALGERQSRVFEVALATEASSSLMQAFAPGKAPRGQFQMSPESLDFNPNLPNEAPNFSSKSVIGKAARITAAVSALVIGAILQGVASLDRMVTLFKLKEGLDLMNLFTRTLKSNMNGNARSSGVLKVDNLIEISVNWFRVLVGNCRTVSDGFIVELLGEPSVVALSRMQRMLSLNLVLSPAYSIFAFVLWRPALDASIALRENLHHLLAVTILDTLKHLPFREICLRDSHGLYDLVAADTLDSEFLSVLESNGIDINLKAAAMVPLRSRLFLDALIDCKMPPVLKIDEGKRVSGQGELKKQCGDNMKKLVGKLVNILDTMQPARFHWQWVELRLLLNEQAVNEKMMDNDISLSEALRSLTPNLDKCTASDNESNFILVLLTRLLVRPDAAPLFSEAVHLLGKSLEDSMLSQAKWLLKGSEVLYGKKSIRQKVINIASELKELSLKPQYWKPWGWCSSDTYPVNNKRDKRKSEAEEGEVVDERTDFNKGSGILDVEGYIVSQQHVTERALIELILPCLDQGSDKLRHNFASEMINQMSNIEQQINVVTRGVGKLPVVPSSAIGSPGSKSSNRKIGKGSSPGISRQSTGSADTVPPSPAALRASLTLRLEFLLRLLPVICSDREPSGRNMRYVLAAVVLRLLGSRIVHEDDGHFINPAVSLKRNVVSPFETSAANELQRGESLFGCLLLVLHVLLSSYQPSWLKLKSVSKHTESNKDYAVFDREVAESLQNDLDRMELPETIRWRIQTAMPVVFPSVRYSISCQPPSVSHTALSCLQPSIPVTILNPSNLNPSQRNSGLTARAGTSLRTKPHTMQSQDLDAETDPWTILEHGAGSGQSPVNSTGISGSDNANLKASNLLKGAVRVRRTDLSYIGTVDDDS